MSTRLHLAYRRRLELVRTNTTARVLAVDAADLDGWLAQVVPLVLDGQRQAVAETDAYLSLEAGLATGTSTEPWGLDPEPLIGVRARRGAPLEDVYARNLRASVGTLRNRLEREVATDIQLAQRNAAWVHTNGDPRIVGYRRVLDTSRENCGLCIAASTRRYRRSDLQPIHSHCGCTVQPIYSTENLPDGVVIDRERLDALYAQVGGATDAATLSRFRANPADLPPTVDPSKLPEVAVVDTPELGPTLIAA